MAHNEGKILGKDMAEFINNVAARFQSLFPHSGLFPEARTEIGAGESPDGELVQAQVLITMKREDAAKFWFPDDDMKDAMSIMKPKVLLIGDERVKDGIFVLFSKLEGQMIRMKFSTQAEANAYKEHFELGQYAVELVKMSVSEDVWFEGTFKGVKPMEVGYRSIDSRHLK